MQLRAQWILICFVIEGVSKEEYSNLWKIIIFKYFQPFKTFSPRVWECKSVAYILEPHEMIRAPHVLACPIGRRSAQTHQKWSSFSIFSRFGPLYHVFGQVTYVQTAQNNSFTWRCVPNCFYFASSAELAGRVFKTMKSDHFLVFLAIRVFFPKFLARLRTGLY